MERELAAALNDLGLSSTEAAIYVALLEHASEGPISAYKLAQTLGRDPANMTKAIGMMVKRGAVTATGKRPRLYTPVPPRAFLGELTARVEARRDEAVAMLERLGPAPPDERPHELTSVPEAFERARLLLAAAERIVLVHAAPEWLDRLRDDLARAADDQGAVVLTRSPALDDAPGPWLRLAVDGAASLTAIGRPGGDALLHGQWSRNPAAAFVAHRELGLEVVLDDVLELLHEGAGADLVRRRADDQWALVQRQVRWKHRWKEAGLAAYTPATPAAAEAGDAAAEAGARAVERVEIDRDEIARAMAEVSAELETPGPEETVDEDATPSEDAFQPETPGQPLKAAEAAAGESADDDGGPLKFIFRRKRKD
ncbi:hypothetical protein GF314_17030 [bacterium]|nr:hypothetical protein [bacterium]